MLDLFDSCFALFLFLNYAPVRSLAATLRDFDTPGFSFDSLEESKELRVVKGASV